MLAPWDRENGLFSHYAYYVPPPHSPPPLRTPLPSPLYLGYIQLGGKPVIIITRGRESRYYALSLAAPSLLPTLRCIAVAARARRLSMQRSNLNNEILMIRGGFLGSGPPPPPSKLSSSEMDSIGRMTLSPPPPPLLCLFAGETVYGETFL